MRGAVLAIAGSALVVLLAGPVAAAGTGTATADHTVAAIGQLVRVRGAGWSGDVGSVVNIVVCGNAALNGAVDCDLANTAEGGVSQNGSFFGGIVIHAPPEPCPCVLRVGDGANPGALSIPITIPGLPSAPPHTFALPRRSITINETRLEGGGSLAAEFGWHAHRALIFTVTNDGTVPLHDPQVAVVWGRGAQPSGFVAPPAIGALAVGQSKVIRVVIPFTGLSFGRYRAIVRVDPVGEIATGAASTSVTPWGLVWSAAALLQTVLVLTVMWARRVPAALPLTDPAAGWYVDPVGAGLRFWDGATWTEQTQETAPIQAGWYPDPLGAATLRLWDGAAWTEHTDQSHGAATTTEPGWYEDPLRGGRLRLWDGRAWNAETQPIDS